MLTKISFKKIILLTGLFIFSFFGVSTYAANLDLIASNFVNKMETKYSKLPCGDQIGKMTFWSKKFGKINQSYSTNTKIPRQQKLLVSILLKTIIKKFESKSKMIKYNCVDKTTETGNKTNNTTGGNISTENTNLKGSQFSTLQTKLLNAVNKERVKYGKKKLILNEKLNKSSQKYAKYLYKVNEGVIYGSSKFWFSHESKDGKTPFDRIKAEGYDFRAAGENIAVGQSKIEKVMKDRMESKGHKENILSKDFEEIGIGYYKGFRVQNFGTQKK